jgi:hypothetical protein
MVEGDANQNGYPDAYEEQEAKLMEQIAQRRKAYMNKYRTAEESYPGPNAPAPKKGRNILGDQYYNPEKTKDLFGGDLVGGDEGL